MIDVRSNLRQFVRTNPLGTSLWNWWSHQRTSLYVLSFPKTGRTWLRMMIGKALIDDLGIAGVDPTALAELHDRARSLPRMRVTHDDNPQLKRPDEVDREKRRYAGKDIIFLVRDPRDTMISYYFQASKRRDRFHGTPAEFLRHDVGSLDTIITYFNVWADCRATPRSFTLVRYEDLHADPRRELVRCLQVIGRVPSERQIDAAVEFSRFDKMQARERAGDSEKARLRAANVEDSESFKTRKGKVGGFRDYLSEEDVEYMNRRIADRLSPFYPEYLTPR